MSSHPEPSTALSTCWFCEQSWGACTCNFPDGEEAAYDESTPGFDTGDMWITAPNVSECTRWYVNPIVVYGEPFVTWVKDQPEILAEISEAKCQAILTWQKPITNVDVVIRLQINGKLDKRVMAALDALADIMRVQAEDGLWTLGQPEAENDEGPSEFVAGIEKATVQAIQEIV